MKPSTWSLPPEYPLTMALLSFATVVAIPYMAGTSSFNQIVALSRALTFAPLLVQTIARPSMGSSRPGTLRKSPAYMSLYKFMAVLLTLCHWYATFTGLKYNMPDAHYHRHSRINPWDVVERSRWERTTTATGKLFGAIYDHPVVTGVAVDVIIAGFSLGIWAALRPLQATDVLGAVVPGHVVEAKEQPDDSSLALRGGAARKRKSITSPKSKSKKDKVPDETSATDTPVSPRRRGRPRKAAAAAAKEDPVEEPGDDTYEPTPEEVASAPLGEEPAQGVDSEAAAVAWGLMAIGGLALGSAGVLGGEMLA